MRKRLRVFILACAVILSSAACVDPTPLASLTEQPSAPASPSPSVTVQGPPATASSRPTWTPGPTATWVVLPSPPPTTDPSTPSVANIARVGVDTARAMAASGDAILVDVRPVGNYAAQHISGAISMPLQQVASRHRELPRDKLIIFYCA